MKAYLGQIILGSAIIIAVLIYVSGTRYQAVARGSGWTPAVIDHWTGKIK